MKQTWVDQIRDKQLQDKLLAERLRMIEFGIISEFAMNSDRVLCFKGCICVPKDPKLESSIL